MTDFNTGYPSVRKIQKYVKDQTAVEVKLLTNDVLVGKMTWQDPQCFCLTDAAGRQVLIARQAIAYIQPQN